MAMMLYFAYPIDRVERTLRLANDRATMRTRAKALGFDIYTPERAWDGGENNPHLQIQHINQFALAHADAMLVHWPLGDESVGCGIEIGQAHSMNIPIAVIRTAVNQPDIQSVALAGMHKVAQYQDSMPALLWLKERANQRNTTPKAKWTGEGTEPSQAYANDAGYDLTYHGELPIHIAPGYGADIPAHVSIQWPDNMWGLLIGRSSTFRTRGLLCNPAVIDAGFRGELFAIVRNIGPIEQTVQPGERIAQIIPLPTCSNNLEMCKVEYLDPSHRGTNGFGSSGL